MPSDDRSLEVNKTNILVAKRGTYKNYKKNAPSETQGQIVGARKSLNGRKNKARRKVKNGQKSRSLLFFSAIFFRPFRLSLAPTICPSVPENVKNVKLLANGRNNSLPFWDLWCIAGRIQPIKSCTLVKRRGRAVQTDSTLLCYASTITKQNKCLALLAPKFDRFETLRNNSQQHATKYDRVYKRA